MPTPTGRATFIVAELEPPGMGLLLGRQQTRARLTWQCLEGIPEFLSGHGWVRIGANRDAVGDSATLDGYLKRYTKTQTADYVAVVLERAGLFELDCDRPAKVRFRPA